MWTLVGVLFIFILLVMFNIFINIIDIEKIRCGMKHNFELLEWFDIMLGAIVLIDLVIGAVLMAHGIAESSPSVLFGMLFILLLICSVITIITKRGSLISIKSFLSNRIRREE